MLNKSKCPDTIFVSAGFMVEVLSGSKGVRGIMLDTISDTYEKAEAKWLGHTTYDKNTRYAVRRVDAMFSFHPVFCNCEDCEVSVLSGGTRSGWPA